MLRSRLRTLPQIRLNKKFENCHQPYLQSLRHNSSGTPGGGGVGKTVAKIIGVTAVAGGGVIGYAKYDPSFRTLVQDNVPYSDFVFERTLGSLNGGKEPSVKSIKGTSSEVGLLSKKLERSSKDIAAGPPELAKEISPERKKIEDLAKGVEQSQVKEEINEDAEVAKLEKRLAAQENEINRENRELKKKVTELREQLENQIEDAIVSQKKAAKAIRLHAKNLNKVLDESEGDFDEVEWAEISADNDKKQAAMKEARKLVNDASELIAKLRTRIDDARNNKNLAANDSIFPAEDAIHLALTKLARAEKQFQDALFEDKMATEYQATLRSVRENVQNELKSILPDFNLIGIEEDLPKEQTNQIIVYLAKKIDHVNKRMAKQLATEQLRIREATFRQKEEDKLASESTISMELSHQAREMNIVQQKKIQEMKDEFDRELRQGLRRQLATHVEHVQECLRTQAKELEREYKELIENKVLEEKGRNELLLSGSFAKLKAIEDLLKSRESLDKAAKKSKELWLACQMLKNTLKVGKLGEPSSDSNLKPLDQELEAIKKAAGPANPFVRQLVHSLPEVALSRGVYTEEALRERFLKVERVCRRMAMIDDTGGSLFKYFISYLQSFFIISPSVSSEEIDKDQEICPSALGTFDIISRVNLCLQQDNLIQALRYMNLLKGEPRNVAKDWINELRILLETRQVADALIAHAAATSIQAYH